MKTMSLETMAKTTIPITTRQAFKVLDEMMSDEEIREALSQTKDEFTTLQHFDLGMWIRNNWIYGDENENDCIKRRREECWLMLVGKKKSDAPLDLPDMVSSAFLGRYYNHLKRKYRE